MITCQRCNTENLEGSQYCDECGALLVGASVRAKRPDTKPTGDADGAAFTGNAVAAPGADRAEPPKAMGAGMSTHSEISAGITSAGAYATPSEGRERIQAGIRAGGFDAHEEGGDDSRLENSGSQRESVGPHARLVIHRGRSAGKEFPLSEDESQIGRWDADGGIFPDVDLDSDDPEAKVSRRHARITRRGDQYYIEDLGSTNGTFINRGRRLLPGDRQLLHDGDEVIVGKTFLRFHVLK